MKSVKILFRRNGKFMDSGQPSSIMSRASLDLSHSIDWETLERLEQLSRDSGSGLLENMIGLFKKNVPLYLSRIQESVETQDSEQLRRHLHSLKSATCYIGAIGVARICDGIRSCIESSDFQKMKNLHLELVEEYRRVLQILG